MEGEPEGLSGAERLAMAARGTQLFDKIGGRGQQLETFKQSQEKDRRALRLGALQSAEGQLTAERAAALKASGSGKETFFKGVTKDGTVVVGQTPTEVIDKGGLDPVVITGQADQRSMAILESQLTENRIRLKDTLALSTWKEKFEDESKQEKEIAQLNIDAKKDITNLNISAKRADQTAAEAATLKLAELNFGREQELINLKHTNSLEKLAEQFGYDQELAAQDLKDNEALLALKQAGSLKELNLQMESRQKIEDAKIALAKDKEANLERQRKIDNKINQNKEDLQRAKFAFEQTTQEWKEASGERKEALQEKLFQLKLRVEEQALKNSNANLELNREKLDLREREVVLKEMAAEMNDKWDNSNFGFSLRILEDADLMSRWGKSATEPSAITPTELTTISFALELATKARSVYNQNTKQYEMKPGITNLGSLANKAIKDLVDSGIEAYQGLKDYLPEQKAKGGVVGMENGGDPLLEAEGIPTGDSLVEEPVEEPVRGPYDMVSPSVLENILKKPETADQEVIITTGETGQNMVNVESPALQNKITLATAPDWENIVKLTGPSPAKIYKRVGNFLHKLAYDVGLANPPSGLQEKLAASLTTLRTDLKNVYMDFGSLEALDDPIKSRGLTAISQGIDELLQPLRISIFNSPLELEAFANTQINKLGSVLESLETRLNEENRGLYSKESIQKARTAREGTLRVLEEFVVMKRGLEIIRKGIPEDESRKNLVDQGLSSTFIQDAFNKQNRVDFERQN